MAQNCDFRPFKERQKEYKTSISNFNQNFLNSKLFYQNFAKIDRSNVRNGWMDGKNGFENLKKKFST